MDVFPSGSRPCTPSGIRRWLLAALSLWMLADACAAQPVSLSVRLDWLPNGYHTPYFLALDKGWFSEQGLDVSIEDGTGSAITVQLVGLGKFDVGHAALSNMAVARAKGVPIISIAGVFRRSDIGLIVPQDSPIHRVSDLKGKTLAFAAGSFEGPFMDVFLASGGLSRGDLTLLNLDPNVKTSTYMAGKVDGMMGSPPTQIPLVAATRPSRGISFGDIGLVVPGTGLVTSEDTLRQKGDALRKFASVVAGAWTYILAGHDREAVSALLKQRPQSKLDPSLVAAQLKEDRAYLFSASTETLPFGFQTDTDWAAGLATLEKVKMIEPGTKPRDYYSNDYLDTELIRNIGSR